MAQHLNLVFQGGGVKAAAYAGALEKLPADSDLKIHGCAGSSAGAIVAAALAIGKGPDDLKEWLSDQRLLAIGSGPKGKLLWELIEKPSLWRVLRRRKLLAEIARMRGAFSTDTLAELLQEKLEERTFAQAYRDTERELHVFVADLRQRELLDYSHLTHPNKPIWEAVLESTCIPLFFRPLRGHLVDGGLLSNFPAQVFDNSPYPTLGFRFVDAKLPTANPENWSILEFLGALVGTATEAHDKRFAPSPKRFQAVGISVGDVQFVDFGALKDMQKPLLDAGRASVAGLDWSDCGSSEAVETHDPDPRGALNMCLRAAQELWNKVSTGEMGTCHEIYQKVHFELLVDSDWTTTYKVSVSYRVEGPVPLWIGRQFQTDDSNTSYGGMSLADIKPSVEERRNGEATKLTCIPAINDPGRKGFLVFYSPPISQECQPRYRDTYSVSVLKEEFSQNLGKGSKGVASYEVKQRATRHVLEEMKFSIKTHQDLGAIRLEPDFQTLGAQTGWVMTQDVTCTEKPNGSPQHTFEVYRLKEFEARLPKEDGGITNKISFRISMSPPANNPP